MKVAVDIDGTISQTFEKYGELLREAGYDTSGIASKPTHWETDFLYPKVPTDTVMQFYKDNWRGMRSSYDVYPGAPVVLHVLAYELVGVTNREVFEQGADGCSVTKQWLREQAIPLQEVVHTSDKPATIAEDGFDVLIEDSVKNAVPVAEQGTPVLLFDQPYNWHLSHKNVIRFSHWAEVPLLLKRLDSR